MENAEGFPSAVLRTILSKLSSLTDFGNHANMVHLNIYIYTCVHLLLNQVGCSEFTLRQSGQHTTLQGSYSAPSCHAWAHHERFRVSSSYPTASFISSTSPPPPPPLSHHPCLSEHPGSFGCVTVKFNMEFHQPFSTNSWTRFTYLEKLHENDTREVNITLWARIQSVLCRLCNMFLPVYG